MSRTPVQLPPCPDCHKQVTDIHVRHEMRLKVRRSDLIAIDGRGMKEQWLEPCGHAVAELTIQTVAGVTFISHLRMVSGWTWQLGLMVDAESEPVTPRVKSALRAVPELTGGPDG